MCLAAALPAVAQASGQEGYACELTAEPVVSLGFGSRYTDESVTRSDIDPESNAEVNAALKPVDDFIRDAATIANQALIRSNGPERANCLVGVMRDWADAGALEDMQTFTSQISVGARKAGLALAYLQVRPLSTRYGHLDAIDEWLVEGAREELRFWAADATPGAQEGNLRAWSSLGVIATGIATDTPELVEQAAEVVSMLICTARPDGSLPQETRRGKFALHYQLHAIAPLTQSAALLDTQGIDLTADCDNALERIVHFAISDLDTGEKSKAYANVEQSYFDGTEQLKAHQLAWADTFLSLYPYASLEERVADLRPLSNSKLGGRQEILLETLFPMIAKE